MSKNQKYQINYNPNYLADNLSTIKVLLYCLSGANVFILFNSLLKEKKSIIVNLEYVNKDIARRIVDVVSGAVHALDGNLQKVSNSIFLVAPYNYDITNEMAREEIKNKLSVSWIKNNANN